MKLLVDENIPLAAELFAPLGEARMVRGRDVDEGFPGIEEIDALAIRSVTQVTPALVDRAVDLRFIGTATIGTDHIDTAYIAEANRRRERPIAVVSAPGSNADSVADYIWAALACLTRDHERPLRERSLGIIGHGNCGSRVAARAEGFGMAVIRHDPPLAERDPDFVSGPLREALAADFVTLHVPLTREGESAHPTWRMIGADEIAAMADAAVLLNSSRGAVVDSGALAEALRAGTVGGAVLDVYDGEPEPPEDLVALAALATPHIAGYAVEGKRRGAIVVYTEMCRHFGVEPADTGALLMSGFDPPSAMAVGFDASGEPDLAADRALRALLDETCRIEATSRELKATLGQPDRGERFDRMRRDYERDCGRHELSAYRVGCHASVAPEVATAIGRRLAGFGVEPGDADPHYVLTPR